MFEVALAYVIHYFGQGPGAITNHLKMQVDLPVSSNTDNIILNLLAKFFPTSVA